MQTVRLATHDDLPGVLRLYKELRSHDPKRTQEQLSEVWDEILNSPYTLLVVGVVDDVVASTCQLGVIPTLTNTGKPFGIIEHVITGSAYRRQGLSEKVMEKALSEAWKLNCYKVMLLSGETRIPAHRLYEKIGFKSGIEKGFVIKAPVNKQ